jgi:predicted nucleic acid-binding protein
VASRRRKPEATAAGAYLDSSAVAKLYVPEPESEALDALLQGRRDLVISELTLTEVLSAVSRRRREGALSRSQALAIRDALRADVESGSFRLIALSPPIHREAERLLLASESMPLRTLDALHLALALSASLPQIVTFDDRMHAAALQAGLTPLIVRA